MAIPHFEGTGEALVWWTGRLRDGLNTGNPDEIRQAILMIVSEGEAHLWERSGEPRKGEPQRWTLYDDPRVTRPRGYH